MNMSVGTFVPNNEIAAYMQNAAANNAKDLADSNTALRAEALSTQASVPVAEPVTDKAQTSSKTSDTVTLSQAAQQRLDALEARFKTADGVQAQPESTPKLPFFGELLDLPEDEYQAGVARNEKWILHQYGLVDQMKRDQENNPTYKTYAKIVLHGKVIGEIDNHGFVGTNNVGIGMRWFAITNEGEYDGTKLKGPALAQHLAEMFVKMFGGKIEIQDTAQTQEAFEATPPLVVHYDEAAAHQDPFWSALQMLKKARLEKYGDSPPGASTQTASSPPQGTN